MFVKVPHALMHKGLPSNALKVYLYLSICTNQDNMAIVRGGIIARACHITQDTVHAAVRRLEEAGLVKKENRFLQGQYIANRYALARLPGKWFTLDLSSKPFALPSSAFGIYLCIKRCANRKGRAFPSYTQMAQMLGGRARATIAAGISLLVALGFVLRLAFRAGKHNLYALEDNKKRSAGVQQPHSKETKCKSSHIQKSECTFRISTWGRFVKFVLQKNIFSSLWRKVVQFLGNNSYIHPHDTKKKLIAILQQLSKQQHFNTS